MTARLLILALTLAAARSAGAQVPQELEGRPISEIRFLGAASAQEDVRSIVELRPGDPLNLAEVRRTVKLLFHLGIFGQVRAFAEPGPRGVVLTFELLGVRRVRSLEFFGNSVFSDAELRRWIRLSPGEEFDRLRLSEAASEIEKRYARRGFRRAQVIAREEEGASEDVRVKLFVQEGPPTRVSRVFIRGDARFPAPRLLEVMEYVPGQVLDEGWLSSALERLRRFYHRQEYLEARVSAPRIDAGLQAMWEVVAVDIHAGEKIRIDFSGNQILSARELRAALPLDRELRLDEATLAEFEEIIRDLYLRQGYARVQVAAELEALHPGRTRRLLFRVQEGPRVRVERLDFFGNRAISSRELLLIIEDTLAEELPQPLLGQAVDPGDMDVFGGPQPRRGQTRRPDRPEGFWIDLVPERVYLPVAYQKGLERIADLYRSRGFLSARAGPPQLVWQKNPARLHLAIPVEEGPRTLIGALAFEGNESIDAADLLHLAESEAAAVRPGGPFDPNALENLRRRLLKNYADRGFAFAHIESRVQFSPDRQLADVTLAVQEGPRVEVRRILLSGNRRTARVVFDRSLALRRGGRYTPQRVSQSTDNLLSLGIFSGSDIRLLDPDRAEEQKDVLVFVRERPAHNLTLIPGISSAEGVRLEIGYTRLNLFGRALELATRLRVNRPVFYPLMPPGLEERYQNMSFVEGLEGFALAGLHWPRAWWLGSNAGVRLDVAAVQEHAASFDLTRFSLTPGLDLHLSPGVDLTLQFDLERIGFDCTVANQSCGAAAGDRWNRYDQGSLFLAGFRPEIVWDRRDNPFRPRRGTLFSFRPEIDKSLSSSREAFFTRLDFLASVYFPLARDVTLAISLRGGAILQLVSGSKTPSHKLFFLGGRNSVRGFREDALIPADLSPPCIEIPGSVNQTECISPGGNAYVNAKIELRFPLVPGRLEAAVFSDGGNLWTDPGHLDPFEIRPTAGFGLRWVTPVGPVAFDFGFNLDPDPARREDTWNLHFNIGEF